MSRFATDTAVEPAGPGRYTATIDEGWWIQRGPNGGYLAAIVLRAVLAEVADPQRSPRSITLHYLRPPVAGPCDVAVTVERAGRGLTTVTARLAQEGRDCILAIAALGVVREGPELDDHPTPEVRPPEELTRHDGVPGIPIRERYDTRHAVGTPPFEYGDEALTGGWIRTADDDPIDEVLLVAVTDAWPPAVFSRMEVPLGVPTIDLTVHFRQAPPREPGWLLVRFRSSMAAEGYVEEDGEVWSADGRLLAQSRQLAVEVTLPPA
ncbi:MAG TPA: thioesterase family protein [Acidimicrobiales bacterium]|nr:thioesterase family protein [Acidimicrobiales bacterium]